MSACPKVRGLAAGFILAATTAGLAAAPTAEGVAPTGIVGGADISILEADKPAPGAREHQRRGNPLWAIPLSKLSATRERPIFLPSRRPPAPIIANIPSEPPKPVAAPREEEQPQLALVGAVTGEHEAIAVFLDQATNGVIRLRTGQDHQGWVLSSVKGRAATLQKGQKTLELSLPAANASPLGVGGAGIPVVPAAAAGSAGELVIPDPGRGAPYIPRHTPKNGESDGL